jgi:heptosyltransferase-1
LPVAVRRWRRTLGQRATWREIGEFRRRLRRTPYDAVIDTQGLCKSSLIARQARGRRYGYAAEVAREALAARFYDETFVIPRNVHAVERNRWLAAAALDYPVDLPLDYGIKAPAVELPWLAAERHALLLTATSRDDKLWDEANWIVVARELTARGLTPVLPSGSALERQRADRIAGAVPGAIVAPPLGLHELAGLMGRARLAIGVDTGLVHLATALRVPTIALYMASDPALTGVYGSGFFPQSGRTRPRTNDGCKYCLCCSPLNRSCADDPPCLFPCFLPGTAARLAAPALARPPAARVSAASGRTLRVLCADRPQPLALAACRLGRRDPRGGTADQGAARRLSGTQPAAHAHDADRPRDRRRD